MTNIYESTCQEYLEGSIFRIKLHNFLTYSDAEFYPGPRLNLVLGPNGTGKSSIVCALCVGLAGSTKLLGRADKIGQFVRHQNDSAYTEIELFFENGNITIRREITKYNKSIWKLNDKLSTMKDVLQLMTQNNIQIDNLCQFLPQDKVGEFSRMNASQLLEATQATIGRGELLEQQQEILNLQRTYQNHELNFGESKHLLETKKLEMDSLQADVDKLTEIKNKMKQTELMRKKCLWLEFEEMKKKINDLKDKKNLIKDEIQKMKNIEFEPVNTVLEKDSEEIMTIENSVGKLLTRKNEISTEIITCKKKTEENENKIDNVVESINEVESQHQESKNRLERYNNILKNITEERKSMPDFEELKESRLKAQQTEDEYEKYLAEARSKRENIDRDLRNQSNKIILLKERKKDYENVRYQREQILNRMDPGAVATYHWLKMGSEENKQSDVTQMFQKKVWGPLAFEISTRDNNYAKYLEDSIPNYLLGAFVTETIDDYNSLIKCRNEQETLNTNGYNTSQNTYPSGGAASQHQPNRINRITVVNIEGGRNNNSSQNTKGSILSDELKKCGFIGFLDEFIDAPEIVMKVLKDHAGIHKILVGTQRTEQLINSGADIFSMLTRHSNKASFVTPNKRYILSVSKYGDHITTTRVHDLRRPVILDASKKDDDAIVTINKEITNCTEAQKRLLNELESIKNNEKMILENKTDNSKNLLSYRNELKNILRNEEKKKSILRKIENENNKLGQDIKKKKDDLIRIYNNTIKKHNELSSEYYMLIEQLFSTIVESNKIKNKLTMLQDIRKKIYLEYLSDLDNKMKSKYNAFLAIKKKIKTKMQIAIKKKQECEETAPLEKYNKAFDAMADNILQLKAQIDNNETSLEMFSNNNSENIFEKYDKLKKEIEELEKKVHVMEDSHNNINNIISEKIETWKAELVNKINNINHHFEQFFMDINCKGEVILNDKNEDISKWGIERNVQFRENAQFSTISAEEQSGGEKSVATIMYLMALQNLTKCPFRVVDEINQGMDAYNERKVFNRITKSSCGSKLAQYFLVTPKLINGLKYHRDTKVIFIYNGPWNICQKDWCLTDIIKKKKLLLKEENYDQVNHHAIKKRRKKS